jgi:hypothetical protein
MPFKHKSGILYPELTFRVSFLEIQSQNCTLAIFAIHKYTLVAPQISEKIQKHTKKMPGTLSSARTCLPPPRHLPTITVTSAEDSTEDSDAQVKLSKVQETE